MICPKCNYQRTTTDNATTPDYRCPACGLVYAKYNAARPGRSQPAQHKFDAKNITIPQAIAISAAVIALGVWLAVHDRPATIPAALDRKPEWSISEITSHPEKISQYKKDLCAWSQREQVRDPSIYNKARAESACKP